jgi:hypothetical protein
MKRKRKIKGPFVPLPLAILDAPAWRATSLGARALHIELRRRLRNDGLNNGKIFRSCRDAAEAIGVGRNAVARWYRELEHYGFVRKTADGFLGSDGQGIAARYRFTDLAYGTHPPTRDFEKWDGKLFAYTPRRRSPKKQNPVTPKVTPRHSKGDIRKASGGGAVCHSKGDIGEAPRCHSKGDTSRLPLPAAAVGQDQGSSSRAPATAQAGDAGSTPAPEAPGERGRSDGLMYYVANVIRRQLDELEARHNRGDAA